MSLSLLAYVPYDQEVLDLGDRVFVEKDNTRPDLL
jgi:hypothetical protein